MVQPATKRLVTEASTVFGKIKTVNGAAPDASGNVTITGGTLTETPVGSGLYVASGGQVTEDPANPGLFLIGV